jgi:ketosteroid isomerase-like protein
MCAITAAQIESWIHKAWKAYSDRSARLTEELYFSNATIFSANSRQTEQAPAVLARRLHEFRENRSGMKVELGRINVHIVGDAAVAAYPYHFSGYKINRDGSAYALDVPFCLGTAVFQLDKSGCLRVLHEHLSAAEAAKRSPLSRDEVSSLLPANHESSGDGSSALSSPPVQFVPATGQDVITAEQVREQMNRYWRLYSNHAKNELDQMYWPETIVFGSGVRHGESARLTSIRRAREMFGPLSSSAVKLGALTVQIVNPNLAVCSYPFHFRTIRVYPSGKRLYMDMPNSRGTYVFKRDERGEIRIIHEHKSSAEAVVPKELKDEEPALVKL